MLLKKIGMEWKATLSICMPVEIAFSVLGQRIKTMLTEPRGRGRVAGG